MVDALSKTPTQPLKPAARPAREGQASGAAPAEAGPLQGSAMARDRVSLGPANPGKVTRRQADKAASALKLLGTEPKGQPKQTTEAVELNSKEKITATWSSPSQKAEAAQALEANKAAERAKLAELGPERTAQYDRVAALIRQDPTAERALQTMLLNDKTPQLTGAKDLNGEGDVLDHLDRIATQANAKSVHTDELLRTFTRELASPTAISQGDGDIGTCVATTATILAAKQNPAEVARLVAGVASEKGQVRLHPAAGETEGPMIQRPANWNVDTKGFGGSRSPSVRLLQPALMNYALKSQLEAKGDQLKSKLKVAPQDLSLKFDPRSDAFTPTGKPDQAANGGHAIKEWKDLNSGLDNEQGNRLLEHLTGQRYEPLTLHDQNREAAFARVTEAVKAGHMVPVGVTYKERGDDGSWHTGGHQMMIRDAGPKGFHVIDPIEGTLHTWSAAKLKKAVTDANLPR